MAARTPWTTGWPSNGKSDSSDPRFVELRLSIGTATPDFSDITLSINDIKNPIYGGIILAPESTEFLRKLQSDLFIDNPFVYVIKLHKVDSQFLTVAQTTVDVIDVGQHE